MPLNVKQRHAFLGLAGIFSFLVVWFFLSNGGVIKPYFLPAPQKVFGSLILLWAQNGLANDILVSVYRVTLGFILAVAISAPLGLLLGTIGAVQAFIEPLVSFIRYIPASAFIPLSIIWFGIDDSQKFFIIFIAVAPFLAILVADAVGRTKKEVIEAGLSLGASPAQIYSKIIVPSSLPAIWDAFRIMFGAAWGFVVLAEIVASSSGLGFAIIRSQRYLQTANVFAIIVVLGIIGLFFDYLFKIAYQRFFPWAKKAV